MRGLTDPGAHAVARAGLWLLVACFAGLAALLAWQHPLAPLALRPYSAALREFTNWPSALPALISVTSPRG